MSVHYQICFADNILIETGSPAMSKHQRFNPSYAVANEIGKVKIISKLDSVEVIE